MYTTFHLNSAQDVNSDLLDAIKAAYKSKPITIIIEEEEVLSQEMKRAQQYFCNKNGSSLSELHRIQLKMSNNNEMKIILDDRLQEDESTYITPKQSVEMLKKNYGI
jgi:hypothetical protein